MTKQKINNLLPGNKSLVLLPMLIIVLGANAENNEKSVNNSQQDTLTYSDNIIQKMDSSFVTYRNQSNIQFDSYQKQMHNEYEMYKKQKKSEYEIFKKQNQLQK